MDIKKFCTDNGIDVGKISDGYHTFDDLYFQRCVLFASLCNVFPDLAWKSRRHADGEMCFGGGWFIVGIDTPEGSYTYHFEDKYWDMYNCQELEVGKEWDGHTGNDVTRLFSLFKTSKKSNMQSWAEREIELACKREAPDRKDGEFDYGCACYESALKAYKSLTSDGHTGFSIGQTKYILNRLLDDKPLTPIEDTEDIWVNVSDMYKLNEGIVTYQCNRMSSLFKNVYTDGTVKYHDNNRLCCVDVQNPDNVYSSGLASTIVDEILPITMPYYPSTQKIRVYCEEFLTDLRNGDFDTVGILALSKPDGDEIEINRFFKESDSGWVEISSEEYEKRKESKF